MPADVQQFIQRYRISAERAGNVKSKTFRLCAVRAGHADPFTACEHSGSMPFLHFSGSLNNGEPG